MVGIMLVPWSRAFRGYTLVIYEEPNPTNSINVRLPETVEFRDLIEVRTSKGMRVAVALASKYAEKIRPVTFNVYKSERIAVMAEMSDEDAERFLRIMKQVSKIPYSRLIPDDVIENPSFEDIERFISINKLLSG